MSGRRAFSWIAVATTSLLMSACGNAAAPTTETTRADTPPRPAGLLATVNGVAITEADVRLRLHAGQRQEEEGAEGAQGTESAEDAQAEIPPEQKRAVLQTLIREELIRQRAVTLGLDADADYQRRLQTMEATVRNFQRHELGQAFFRHEIEGGVHISDEEIQGYFDQHAAELRTTRHVFQILKRNRGDIDAIHQALAGGASFEALAAQQFPGLPANTSPPWDLGFLRWEQLPEPWQAIVPTLSPGQTSDVIPGPGGRFWIIKLVELREDPSIDMESSRAAISNTLTVHQIDERRQQFERELSASAHVEYTAGNAPTP